MGFQCGIVGLPNVGKSTIFNAVTQAGAASANYPFCTIDPNVGRVDVPDPRLDQIASIVKPQKIWPTSMEFIDIAGLVRGASKGEGLGNQFLGHIKSVDAIAHVVRCFDSTEIVHVEGSVDPIRDIETIETELIFSDVNTVQVALDRYRRLNKVPQKKLNLVVAMLEALDAHLQKLLPSRSFPLADYIQDTVEVEHAFRDLHMITAKKMIYVCNVEEELASGEKDNQWTKKVKDHAASTNTEVVIISGKIEEELSQLSSEDKNEMIKDLGMKEPGLNRVIRAGYRALGLQTYFTAGEKEVRAWTIPAGAKAPQAAGVIHSDFERGFICAETYLIPDLLKHGSKVKLKEVGLLRTEGKEYVVKDGDVLEFRFNV